MVGDTLPNYQGLFVRDEEFSKEQFIKVSKHLAERAYVMPNWHKKERFYPLWTKIRSGLYSKASTGTVGSLEDEVGEENLMSLLASLYHSDEEFRETVDKKAIEIGGCSHGMNKGDKPLASKIFVEDLEFKYPKLRGAMMKWAREHDGMGGHSEPLSDEDLKHKFDDWFKWMHRNFRDCFHCLTRICASKDRLREEFEELIEESDEFEELLLEKHYTYTRYGGGGKDELQEEDTVDNEQSRVGKSSSQRREEEEERRDTEFRRLRDIGFLTENNTVHEGRIKGSMVKFTKEVETITGKSEEPNAEDVKEAWFSWMFNKLDKAWVDFTMSYSDKCNFEEWLRELWEGRDDFSDRVAEKYQHDKDLLEGNGDPDEDEEGQRKHPFNERMEEYGAETVKKEPKFDELNEQETGSQVVAEDGEQTEKEDRDREEEQGEGYWDQFETREEGLNNEFRREDGDEEEGGEGDSEETNEDEGLPDEEGTLGSFANQESTSEQAEADGGEGGTQTKGRNKASRNSRTSGSWRMRMKRWGGKTVTSSEMYELDEIRNEIIRENVWTALEKIPSDSVDCVVTSPPYWNLRDYDGEEFQPIGGEPDCDHVFHKGECYHCGAWEGQLGHEPEPSMFIDNIVAIMQKISRILKPTGSLFLNIGDNFAGKDFDGDLKCTRKSMMMIPYRIYMRMCELGWTMRQPVMWAKQVQLQDGSVHGATNPTSVKDRINHTFEPMWWFTNSPDYYSDIFSVRREPKTDPQDMSDYGGKYDSDEYDDEMYNSPTARAAREGYEPSLYHDAGANIPDVWQIPTGSAGKEHPAVFSPELPKKPIRMTCPKWVCDFCGEPFQRVVEDGESEGWERNCNHSSHEKRPGIVFEPFCGRGTTPKRAEDEGRDWITTEVSDKYADFAEDYISGARKTELADFGD